METVGGVDVLGQFYRLHVLVTDMEPRRLVFWSLLNLLIHVLLCWPMVNELQ